MLECTCPHFGSVLLSLTKFAGASVGSGFTVHSSMDMKSVQLVKGESSMYILIEYLVVSFQKN